MALFDVDSTDKVYGGPVGNQNQWVIGVTSNSFDKLTKIINTYCSECNCELVQISIAYCYQESFNHHKAMAVVKRK